MAPPLVYRLPLHPRTLLLGSAGNTYSLDRSDGPVLEEKMLGEVEGIVGEDRWEVIGELLLISSHAHINGSTESFCTSHGPLFKVFI